MPENAGYADKSHECGCNHMAAIRPGGSSDCRAAALPGGDVGSASCVYPLNPLSSRFFGGSTSIKSLISFARAVALLRKVVGWGTEKSFHSRGISDYNRFAECAVPQTVRSAHPVGRRFSSLWRKQCARNPFVWGGREKTVRETLVSLEASVGKEELYQCRVWP